jgi:hypothetical protein
MGSFSGKGDMHRFWSSTVLVWATASAAIILSLMSLLDICTGGCKEAAKFSIFGISFGWFGIAFFGTAGIFFAISRRFPAAEIAFWAMVCAAAGAEARFIWLQKVVMKAWCPICLLLAATVFAAAAVSTARVVKKGGGGPMKSATRVLVASIVAMAIGFFGAAAGVRQEAQAAGPDYFLGKRDADVTVYFISDWFCPACRKVESTIERMYPEIAAVAKVAFVDFPVHPETSNFTPYNLQFLAFEKPKYIQLRKALNDLAVKTKTPTNEQVQAAVTPLGVVLRPLNFMDVMAGMKFNEGIYRGYGVGGTPAVVVVNEKTKKKVMLSGDRQITTSEVREALSKVKK